MRSILFLLTFMFFLPKGNICQTITIGNTTLTKRDVATGLIIPWEITWGPDDHIWVTERRGHVLRIEPETGNTQTILNHEGAVFANGGEPGMLGMVHHPNFPDSPYVFIAYNFSEGFQIYERLVRFTWDGTDLSNEAILLDNIPAFNIHNGARLVISPEEKIMMSMGDRGNTDLSQDKNSLNGKILRINLDGTIPGDNPDPASYIWSYGHRNPQGLWYGPSGILYSSEHGQQNSDELNIIEEDRNYGWPNVEGACDDPAETSFCNTFNVKEPLIEWSPCVAVCGIEYYNHPAIPELENSILMAVLGGISVSPEPRVSQLKLADDGLSIIEENKFFTTFGRIRDVCINPHNGAIYFATNGPEYPGEGPNQIIEYRNLEYSPVSSPNILNAHQFIHVFPSPMQEEGIIEFSPSFIGSDFQIFSFTGQEILSSNIDQSTIELRTSAWATGAYYVKAQNHFGTITKTFIKK